MLVEIVEKLDVLTSAHWVAICGLTALVAFILGWASKSVRSNEVSAEGQPWPHARSASSGETTPASAQPAARASSPASQIFLTTKQEAQIDASIRSGRMLNAIKLVRDVSGLPLKASKSFVEARKRELSA